MTAPLVVRAGEQIVCPGCQAVLLTFEEDVHGRAELRAAMRPALSGRRRESLCGRCRTPWGLTGVIGGGSKEIGAEPGPRIHLRSGEWTGWRGLGGE